MDRDTLSWLIEGYLTKHKSDDIPTISQGLAEKIDNTLLNEGMMIRDKIMNDIFR
jgi:hypothetical protein